MKANLTALLAALVLAGCASTAPLNEAPVATPTAWKAEGWTTAAPAAAAQARGAWWQVFGDAQLDALIQQAEAQSPTLAQAAARLAQAHALLGSARAAQLPNLGLNAGAQRAGTAGQAANAFALGAQLGYEIDLSGRLRGGRDAAQLDAQAQAQLFESAKLMLQADVAQAYFQLRATEREHQLVRDTAASYRDALRVTERRVQAGEAAELELARLKSEAAGTDAEAAQLAQRRALLENLLALLTGQPASNLRLAATAAVATLPAIPPGLPSTLLARRPDVAAAQTQLLAAQARLGVAQRAWFPQLALTAQGGLASADLGDLLKGAARSWSLGALFALPLFDGGARQAGVDGARAAAEGALAAHRQAVLVAFKDVEDQLASLSGLQQQQLALAEAVSAAERAAALSAARERGGIVAPLERLDAQRSALRQRRAALQVEAAQAQATVGLVRALGGSWG